MKICSRCEVEKSFECFLKRKDRKSGFASACKDCVNAGRREKAKLNPEKVREQSKRNYKKNREKHLDWAKKYQVGKSKERLEKDKEYRKKWYLENRERVRKQRKNQKERINEWSKKYKEKISLQKKMAHRAINLEIRKGNIVRPKECSICKSDKYKIEGHHEDYSKPLEIIWVCTYCHKAIHKELKLRSSNASQISK